MPEDVFLFFHTFSLENLSWMWLHVLICQWIPRRLLAWELQWSQISQPNKASFSCTDHVRTWPNGTWVFPRLCTLELCNNFLKCGPRIVSLGSAPQNRGLEVRQGQVHEQVKPCPLDHRAYSIEKLWEGPKGRSTISFFELGLSWLISSFGHFFMKCVLSCNTLGYATRKILHTLLLFFFFFFSEF
jgi:hypothetical protein